jgi:hypothetical protein
MANLSQILSELDSAAQKIQDISDEVVDMIIINDNRFATQSMNFRLKDIMYEIRRASRSIKENRDIIEECCSALGLSVNPVSGGSGSAYGPGTGGGVRPQAVMTRF